MFRGKYGPVRVSYDRDDVDDKEVVEQLEKSAVTKIAPSLTNSQQISLDCTSTSLLQQTG